MDKADRHQVLALKLERIHTDRTCTVISGSFKGVGALRHTITAHSAGNRLVGINSPGIRIDIVAGIELRESI